MLCCAVLCNALPFVNWGAVLTACTHFPKFSFTFMTPCGACSLRQISHCKILAITHTHTHTHKDMHKIRSQSHHLRMSTKHRLLLPQTKTPPPPSHHRLPHPPTFQSHPPPALIPTHQICINQRHSKHELSTSLACRQPHWRNVPTHTLNSHLLLLKPVITCFLTPSKLRVSSASSTTLRVRGRG